MNGRKWWGYLHMSGTTHLKQYYGPEDLAEARGSPFVRLVFGPWDCDGRAGAEKMLRSEYEKIVTLLEKLGHNGVGF